MAPRFRRGPTNHAVFAVGPWMQGYLSRRPSELKRGFERLGRRVERSPRFADWLAAPEVQLGKNPASCPVQIPSAAVEEDHPGIVKLAKEYDELFEIVQDSILAHRSKLASFGYMLKKCNPFKNMCTKWKKLVNCRATGILE